jgi:hypothetical protein
MSQHDLECGVPIKIGEQGLIFSWKTAYACAVILSQIAVFPAYADVNELQPLDFGRWIITANNAQHSIILNTNGSYSSSPALVMLDPPSEGIYQITELPAFAEIISVDVTMTQSLQGGGSEDFTLQDFQVIAPDADGAGETTITLGATARTSGSGNDYDDSVYNGTLELDINL